MIHAAPPAGFPVHPWLIWAIPASFVLVGVILFLNRVLRLRRRMRRDPEELLLGAVSESLQRRRLPCNVESSQASRFHNRPGRVSVRHNG